MEVKTVEVERFITIKFNERDLIKLRDEINHVIPKIDSYNETKYRDDDPKVSIEKMRELRNILNNSLNDVKSCNVE